MCIPKGMPTTCPLSFSLLLLWAFQLQRMSQNQPSEEELVAEELGIDKWGQDRMLTIVRNLPSRKKKKWIELTALLNPPLLPRKNKHDC